MDWIGTLMRDYCDPSSRLVLPRSENSVEDDDDREGWFLCEMIAQNRFRLNAYGATNRRWESRLNAAGILIDDDAEAMLSTPELSVPTPISAEVVILDGKEWQGDSMVRINEEVARRGLIAPSPLVACILRLAFSSRERLADLGYRAVNVMHQPLQDAVGHTGQLALEEKWLTYRFETDRICPRSGYVYEVPRH